jgi:TonB family protein
LNASIRSRSLVLTVLVHGFIFLALLFIMMRSSMPPFPDVAGGSGGVLVNIGYLDAASGEIQPMSENTSQEPNPVKEQPQPKTEEEKILTSNDAESPLIKEVDKKKTTKVNKKNVKTTVPPVITKKEIPVPVRKVDPLALYQGKNTKSTSQGTASSGAGDQGDKNGDPFSKYTGKNGNGSGPGEGTGTGPGKGPGSGGGISFDLTGRRLLRKPSIDDKSQETGRVVVSITVDKDGNVTEARPGARGSTTTSSYLFGKAKEAAMKAKFNPNPDGADIQKGTMTFVFLVQ